MGLAWPWRHVTCYKYQHFPRETIGNATERHSKSFGLRLRYQRREVFSLALTHFSYSQPYYVSRRISKKVAELQAPGLAEICHMAYFLCKNRAQALQSFLAEY
jgi:hypothetical protein